MKCQGCHFAMAQVYCMESQAALCNGCSSVMGEHIMRYRLCALCDCNPARIFCRNDNAALCEACDADIHLSNPLALCHDRVPLGPLDAAPIKETQPASKEHLQRRASDDSNAETQDVVEVVQVPATSGSTVLFVPKAEPCLKDFDVFDFDSPLFGGEFLDSGAEDWGCAPASPSDGVVPTIETADSGASSAASAALSADAASSADEAPAKKLAKQDTFSSPQRPAATPAQFVPSMPAIPSSAATGSGPFDMPMLHVGGATPALDREARVMRYREKRKRRTFEKTIRYQSRKAYAEVRPRIKGRFATKEEVAAMKAAGTCFPMVPCA